ncbi:MAG: amino acid permease, partial [Bacteroidota bacterium]
PNNTQDTTLALHYPFRSICISDSTFKRSAAFDMIRYISHRYGFGTYLHYLNGYVSRDTHQEARTTLKRLIHLGEASRSNVYLNTLISPSYTTAIAQSIQMPGVSGKDNNMFLFEYARDKEEELNIILENMKLVKASNFDIGILCSTERGFGYRSSVHIWIGQNDYQNANLMILLAYIMLGHPDWKRAQIKIFAIFPEQELGEQRKKLEALTRDGRIPISPQNIEVVSRQETTRKRDVIKERSAEADLVMVGFLPEQLKQKGGEVFQDYEGLANILFLHSGSGQEKVIE